MSKLLFITQDLAIGGGTSSLSALYEVIKDRYDISVFLLADEGEANVSYKDKLIKSKLITRLYYCNRTNTKGVKKCLVLATKMLCKVLRYIGVNIDKWQVWLNKNILPSCDCVISFGEGVATEFACHINCHRRIAWIHYEVSKDAFSQCFFKLYSNFDKIVTVSDVIANNLAEKYPELSQRIVGIHNIIDTKNILRLSKEYVADAYINNKFNIISLGRVTPVKRFPEIPAIAKRLKNYGISFVWRIYGPNVDNDELMKLIDNISKYNVEDCVRYCGNRINPYPYLAQANLLVILSYTEACPMIINEARILNVPIISTNYATASEFIENGVDGIICPIENVSEEIISYISDKNIRESLFEHSKQRVQDNITAIDRFHLLVNN